MRPDPNAPLTERQFQMVRLMAEGMSDKEIATRMGIAVGTAQKHTANLLARLGARNRAHAVAIAFGVVKGETT